MDVRYNLVLIATAVTVRYEPYEPVITCVNGAGQMIPPHIIAKSKMKRALDGFDTHCAPLGSTGSVSSSGWTKRGIAHLWFKQSFLPKIGMERPQILVLDGHDSHNFVELIEVAMANRIHIVEIPAHTSHWHWCSYKRFNEPGPPTSRGPKGHQRKTNWPVE